MDAAPVLWARCAVLLRTALWVIGHSRQNLWRAEPISMGQDQHSGSARTTDHHAHRTHRRGREPIRHVPGVGVTCVDPTIPAVMSELRALLDDEFSRRVRYRSPNPRVHRTLGPKRSRRLTSCVVRGACFGASWRSGRACHRGTAFTESRTFASASGEAGTREPICACRTNAVGLRVLWRGCAVQLRTAHIRQSGRRATIAVGAGPSAFGDLWWDSAPPRPSIIMAPESRGHT